MWLEDKNFSKGNWRFVLPVIMVFLSLMMVSQVKYPTFKKLDFRAQRTFPKMVGIVLLFGLLVLFRDWILPFVLPLMFTAYLIYGFIRPRISRKMRHDIEDEDDDDDPSSDTA